MVSILPFTSILKSSFFMPGTASDTLYSSLFSVMFTEGMRAVRLQKPLSLSNHSFQGLKKSSKRAGNLSDVVVNACLLITYVFLIGSIYTATKLCFQPHTNERPWSVRNMTLI